MKSLIILLWEYYISEWRRTVKALILPLIVFVVIILGFSCINPKIIHSFYSNQLTVLGILIGFSISFHAIILSADSEEFKKAKMYFGDNEKDLKPLSLFHQEVAGNIILIIVQAILILVNVIVPLFCAVFEQSSVMLAINISGIIYVVELLICSMIDSYLIVTTNRK